MAGGSPNQGGGNQKNMEVYNADLPSGTASTAGVLSVPVNVPFSGSPEAIPLAHVGGNEGLYVESVLLSGADAADFSITTPVVDPFLIAAAGNRDVVVEYTGAGSGAMASLDVTYSGGQSQSVMLLPETGAVGSLVAGALVLVGLDRRRRRGRAV